MVSLIIDHLSHDLFQNFEIGGLAHHFVHLMAPSLLDESLFGVTCACNNKWLWHIVGLKIMAYFVCCLISIHDRHRAVHEYETVVLLRQFHVLVCALHQLNGLIAVVCLVYDIFDTSETHLGKLNCQT